MAMEEKMNQENQPTIDETLKTLGMALFVFWMLVRVFYDVIIAFLLMEIGIHGEFGVQLAIYIMLPLGIFLILYAHRRQLRSFVQEATRVGVTKALENIAKRQAGPGPESISDPL